ncbi:class I SAM-dependent methyltransferase [Phenylobacterium aquaticum]|uniref:class I SAM-dependent methyltransferase n=1 Tax=Phenylobacterium aquaticum TaxID=1763816 RepID=UPI0026ED0CA7|nr:class I SAM-dependent methyltransferase [Phenylobacterium aquaticum]
MTGEGVGRPCPACGGALGAWRHDWLFRCRACGLLHADFTVEIPDVAGGDRVDEARREAGLETVRERNNARLLEALAAMVAPGARLLDVGAGPGFLLRHAARLGFAVEGIEPDANVIATARAQGAQVRHGYFPDALDADDRFDVIVFNDVFEHIPDITAAFAACARHLKPGGVLCLNCPNRDGFFFKVAEVLDRLGMGGAHDRLWQRGLPSPHLWYFAPRDLTRAASGVGLVAERRLDLDTVQIKGLWSRIRCVRDEPLLRSAAAWVFAVATYPIARLAPADAVVSFFRKPG